MPKLPQKEGFGSPSFRHYLQALSILALLPLLAYFNTFTHTFHYDDFVIWDPDFHDTDTYIDLHRYQNVIDVFANLQNRTILRYTFAANYHLSERNVFSYHLVNTAIHIWCAIGLFFLCLALLKKSTHFFEREWGFRLALAAALLFALSPLATQSVTYIINRSSSLATLCYLCSFLFFIKGKNRPLGSGSWFYCCSLFFFALGLGSKEIVITLPALAILTFYFFSTSPVLALIKKNLLNILVLLALAFGYIYSRGGIHVPELGVFSSSIGMGPGQKSTYLVSQLNVITYYYLRLLCFPFNQNLNPDFPDGIPLFSMKSFVAILIISLPLIFALRYRAFSVLSLMACWFFITLTPTSSLVPLSDLAMEQRVYLPAAGFFSVATILAARIYPSGNWKILAVLIPLLFFTSTLARNRVWVDDYTLWSDVLAKSPYKSKPYNNLGEALFKEKKNYAGAIAHFQKAITIDPQNAKAHKNLAALYYETGKYDEAIRKFEHVYFLYPRYKRVASVFLGDSYFLKMDFKPAKKYFIEAIRLGANKIYCYKKLGKIHNALGALDKARDVYLAGLKLKPDDPYLKFHLAGVYFRQKSYKESERLYLEVFKSAPYFREVMVNLGLLYKSMKDYPSALHWLKKNVENEPSSINARINLALLYKEMGDLKAYTDALEKAIQLDPTDFKTYNLIGAAHMLQSEYSKAEKAYKKALELSPGNKNIKRNLDISQRAETAKKLGKEFKIVEQEDNFAE